MKPSELVLRCFAEKKEGQWQALCLDLCLAAQADTFEEAREKLDRMICSYVHDAVAGEDRARDIGGFLVCRIYVLRYSGAFASSFKGLAG